MKDEGKVRKRDNIPPVHLKKYVESGNTYARMNLFMYVMCLSV